MYLIIYYDQLNHWVQDSYSDGDRYMRAMGHIELINMKDQSRLIVNDFTDPDKDEWEKLEVGKNYN